MINTRKIDICKNVKKNIARIEKGSNFTSPTRTKGRGGELEEFIDNIEEVKGLKN